MANETFTQLSHTQGLVLFDGDCPLCQKSIAVLKRLDWLHRLQYHNARVADLESLVNFRLDQSKLLEEMHVITPDRQHKYIGFNGFRWIAWRLPATMVLAPLLYLPGVPWLGKRIYRWVARNRFQLVPCHDGACQVNLKKS